MKNYFRPHYRFRINQPHVTENSLCNYNNHYTMHKV